MKNRFLYILFLSFILMTGLINAQDKAVTGNDATFNFIVTTISGNPTAGGVSFA